MKDAGRGAPALWQEPLSGVLASEVGEHKKSWGHAHPTLARLQKLSAFFDHFGEHETPSLFMLPRLRGFRLMPDLSIGRRQGKAIRPSWRDQADINKQGNVMCKRAGTLAAGLGLLLLSACGGSDEIPASELEMVQSDSRVVRLGSIMERADTLLIPSLHTSYSISAQGQTVTERLDEGFACAGQRCVVNGGGEAISLDDFADPSTDAELIVTRADLGLQDGFDTLTFSASSPAANADAIPDLAITGSLAADHYGVWGQDGAAFLLVTDISISGEYQGTPFAGDLRSVIPYVAGNPSGTNPAGTGSATWTGVAEAASTRSFQRRQGTATLTIADLSSPRVGVEVDIAGHAVGSAAWSDIPLTNGGFATGNVGSDYLEGNFHGSSHGEAYGVFDTGAYVGAFAAKRTR